MSKIAIFGVSGFALEVADICAHLGYCEIVLLCKDNEEVPLQSGLQIFPESKVFELKDNGFVFSIGIGEPGVRKKIAERYSNLTFPNLIHASATLGRGQLQAIHEQKGNIICAGCRLTNNILVGDFIILNLNTTVGHDSELGSYVSAMPGVNISGNVSLSDMVYIGTSATILQGSSIDNKLKIGEAAIVGAAALVNKDVRASTTVVGIPSKEISK